MNGAEKLWMSQRLPLKSNWTARLGDVQTPEWELAQGEVRYSWGLLNVYGAPEDSTQRVVNAGVCVCVRVVVTSHLPDRVGGVTGAVLVTDKTVEAWGAESLLAVRAFEACFTQTGSGDVMTLGSILTLTLLVTLRTKGSHRTVVLTPVEKKKKDPIWLYDFWFINAIFCTYIFNCT